MKPPRARLMLGWKVISRASRIRWANLLLLVIVFFALPAGVPAESNGAIKMYWTLSSAGTIQRANPDGSGVEDVVIGLSSPIGIAIDPIGAQIYWTDDVEGKIQRANLDGSGVEDVLTGLLNPFGLALDLTGGKVYWGENPSFNVGDAIRRANLDGSGVEDIITSDVVAPGGMALDIAAGKIYWTDSGLWTIKRANLDGSFAETLVQGGAAINDVALDLAAGKMYWTVERALKIQRANLDGSAVGDIVTGVGNPFGIALDLGPGKIYWTRNEGGDTISRSNLDGTDAEEILTFDHTANPAFIALLFPPQQVAIDIKPRSCPNPLNVRSKGTVTVAILGSDDLDVREIDVASVRLEGVAPVRSAVEDVTTPFEPMVDKEDAYDCVVAGPDGFEDLVLKFKAQDLVQAIETEFTPPPITHGDVLVLSLDAELTEGTAIEGEDVVIIKKKGRR